MEKSDSESQSYLSGALRGNLDDEAIFNNQFYWKYENSKFEGYKYSGFSICDNFFEPYTVKKITSVQIPKKNSPQPKSKVLKTLTFSLSKKPLISIFYQDSKPEIPLPSSPNTLTKPHNIQIKPSQRVIFNNKKSETKLFTYSSVPITKPVIPIQIVTIPKDLQVTSRKKFMDQIKEIRINFDKTEKPTTFDIRIPKTAENFGTPLLSNRAEIKKLTATDNSVPMQPDITNRPYSNYKSHQLIGKPKKSLSNLSNQESYVKPKVKILSPYQSVWPKKILADYYNLKLVADHKSNAKKYKLVKISRSRGHKSEAVEKYF